jgi:hypothetical protein
VDKSEKHLKESELLFGEAVAARKQELHQFLKSCGPLEYLQHKVCAGALNGDPSLVQSMAAVLARKVWQNEELNPVDRFWLGALLVEVYGSPRAAKAICGDDGPGRPKNTARAYKVAISAFHAIMDRGATTMDEAWNMAAEECSVDARTARKYWSQWKPVWSGRNFKHSCGDEMTLEDAVNVMLKGNRDRNP